MLGNLIEPFGKFNDIIINKVIKNRKFNARQEINRNHKQDLTGYNV